MRPITSFGNPKAAPECLPEMREDKMLFNINEMLLVRSCETPTKRNMRADITRARYARKGLRLPSDLRDKE
jgi:hypothetical protein